MQFHLNIQPGVSSHHIEHQHNLLLIGSCFTEHIEKKLQGLKFNSSANPFGIVFNPLSIAKSLTRILDKVYFTEQDILEEGDTWISLETHSSLSKPSKQELLDTLNTLIDEWYTRLKAANWLIFTFGSAFYYEHLESGNIVANCHKLPGKLFHKNLSETTHIISDYNLLLKKLEVFNPNLNLIFTVSPVKHLRDGVIENNLSKAILIQSVHAIIKQNKRCLYFPSYELVNDDLRDYRFYEADMAHPNKQAIEYVWDKFSAMFFTSDTQQVIAKIQEINSAIHHRPLNIHSKSFTEFKAAQLKKCSALQAAYPYLQLDKELHYFSGS